MKMEPYEGATKSRQAISRKEVSKVNKEKGQYKTILGASRYLCFESLKMRNEPNEGLPTKKSGSYHGSKVLNSKADHNTSFQMGDTEKRRKLRFAKQITEIEEKR